MKQINHYITRQKIKSELAELDTEPDSLYSLLSLSARFVIKKDYESALDTMDKIIELHGPTANRYLNGALCLYRLGEINNATESLEESLKLDLENTDAATLLSKLQQRLKELAKYTMLVYS